MKKLLLFILLTFSLIFPSQIKAQGEIYQNWTKSQNIQPGFGVGLFWYQIRKSPEVYADANGVPIYMFQIYFLSDSYYTPERYMNGISFRVPTYVPNMSILVDGTPVINNTYKSISFWILIKGDFNRGVGDLGGSIITYSSNPKITLIFQNPYPY